MRWFREDRLIHVHPERRVAPRGLLVLASLSALALAAPPVQAVAQEYQDVPGAQGWQEPLLVAQDGESGTWGTCYWTINNGVLTIGAGQLEPTSHYSPCRNYSDKITSIVFEDGVTAPEYCGSLFAGLTSLETVNLSGLNSTSANNMNGMFYGCTSLESITFGQNWSTASVTNMSSMFEGCTRLASLDASGWNTENVTNMSYMFEGCISLTDITGEQNWNTSKVRNMSSMFEGCESLASLDTSYWNTSSVTSAGNMFEGCTNLASFTVGQNYNIKYTDMFPDANNATKRWWSCEKTVWLSKEDICSSSYADKAGTYKTKSHIPSFKTYSLTLDGMIGVNFYCDLSSLSQDEREETSVHFSLGKGGRQRFPEASYSDSTGDDGHRAFTCKVTSVEMAEEITATLYNGSSPIVDDNNKTIEATGSVMAYIDYVTNPQTTGFDDETINLAKAIADYGNCMQVFLSKSNGWPLSDYTDIHGFKNWIDYLALADSYKTKEDVISSKILGSKMESVDVPMGNPAGRARGDTHAGGISLDVRVGMLKTTSFPLPAVPRC